MLEILVGSIAYVIMFVRFCFFFAIYDAKKSFQTWSALLMTLAIMVFSDSEAVMMLVPWLALIILAVVQHEPLQEKSMFEGWEDDSWDDDECETQDRQPAVPTLVYKEGKRV